MTGNAKSIGADWACRQSFARQDAGLTECAKVTDSSYRYTHDASANANGDTIQYGDDSFLKHGAFQWAFQS